MSKSKFTWGDTVQVRKTASAEMQPGKLVAICGIRQIETEEQMREFNVSMGTHLYIIEFRDGTSREVPEEYLEPLDQ